MTCPSLVTSSVQGIAVCSICVTVECDDLQASYTICTRHTSLEVVCHHVTGLIDSHGDADQADLFKELFKGLVEAISGLCVWV